MATPIHVEAVVSPDGKIEISVPELAPSQRIQVTIEPDAPLADERRHVIDILRESSGHQLFKTAEEVDAYIAEERDSWER